MPALPPALNLRIDLAPGIRIGPDKINLLEAIAARGSISAAVRALGMSYARAWLLVDELNRAFAEPVVAGQARGVGAAVTPLGERLVASCRAVERDAAEAATRHLDRGHLAGLEGALAPRRAGQGASRRLARSAPRLSRIG